MKDYNVFESAEYENAAKIILDESSNVNVSFISPDNQVSTESSPTEANEPDTRIANGLLELGSTDPMCTGMKIYQRTKFQFEPGLNVLVGCNGAGKSTLLTMLQHKLDESKIPYITHDGVRNENIRDAKDRAMQSGDVGTFAFLVVASEGESVRSSIANTFGKIGDKVRKLPPDTKAFWILLDAVDSGLSIDNIVELRNGLDFVLKNKSCDTYIVVAANSYEMARNAHCINVVAGKEISFADYEDYRKFILESGKAKDKRDRAT